MSSFLMFILGIIVGVIAAWWFFERRDASSRVEIEEGWKRKLAHVEQEVRRADAAHEETKERLRLLQQEKVAQQVTPPAEPAPAPAAATPAAPPAPAASAPAPAPATTTAPEPPAPSGPSEAERLAQARRRIDAKLAQLPAGSSARARLVAERAALAGREAEGGAAAAVPVRAPVRLFTPPPEEPDDIEQIRGIGPVLRERLNELGITTFKQIAALTPEDIERIDEVLEFKGRIEREDWIGQARTLGGADDRPAM